MADRRRAGGRAARMAARAAPLPAAERPVRPGMRGGAYKPLTDSECQQVYETALRLIEEVGLADPAPEFTEAVTAAGGWMDEGGRLHYPRGLVERVITQDAAREWVWHGIDEERSLEVGGEKVHFGTSGAAVLMLDYHTRTFRPSAAADLYDAARLADTLEHIHYFVRTVVTRDLETPREVDLNTAYATMMGTSKPQGVSFFKPANVYEAVEMYDHVLGGEGEFRRRPFVAANNTFVVPPLRFAYESVECMVAQIRCGMPIKLISAGQAGATSPAALAGSLAQALAECLAGVTSVNLLSPGHPCSLDMWPFVSDLRTGAMSGGSGEEAVMMAAAAQVVNWLGLPSGVAAGMADSKLPDGQAGYEKGITTVLAGQAGANLINESAGMLGSLLVCSLEALVVDNDMLGAANRTIRGIEVNPDSLSLESIKETIFGPGHFLGAEQTLRLMQRDYVYPQVGDRNSPDDWRDQGSTSAAERAAEHVRKVMRTHFPAHVTREQDAWIRERMPIALPEDEMVGLGTRW